MEDATLVIVVMQFGPIYRLHSLLPKELGGDIEQRIPGIDLPQAQKCQRDRGIQGYYV
jgi:hypothetical protein